MKKIIFITTLMLTFTALAHKGAPYSAEKDKFKLIHVNDLAQLIEAKKPIYIYDANPDKVRKDEGLILGAKTLETAIQFDTGKVLPPNKKAKLIFYCHSTS